LKTRSPGLKSGAGTGWYGFGAEQAGVRYKIWCLGPGSENVETRAYGHKLRKKSAPSSKQYLRGLSRALQNRVFPQPVEPNLPNSDFSAAYLSPCSGGENVRLKRLKRPKSSPGPRTLLNIALSPLFHEGAQNFRLINLSTLPSERLRIRQTNQRPACKCPLGNVLLLL
jgi:hypothetical protein